MINTNLNSRQVNKQNEDYTRNLKGRWKALSTEKWQTLRTHAEVIKQVLDSEQEIDIKIKHLQGQISQLGGLPPLDPEVQSVFLDLIRSNRIMDKIGVRSEPIPKTECKYEYLKKRFEAMLQSSQTNEMGSKYFFNEKPQEDPQEKPQNNSTAQILGSKSSNPIRPGETRPAEQPRKTVSELQDEFLKNIEQNEYNGINEILEGLLELSNKLEEIGSGINEKNNVEFWKSVEDKIANYYNEILNQNKCNEEGLNKICEDLVNGFNTICSKEFQRIQDKLYKFTGKVIYRMNQQFQRAIAQLLDKQLNFEQEREWPSFETIQVLIDKVPNKLRQEIDDYVEREISTKIDKLCSSKIVDEMTIEELKQDVDILKTLNSKIPTGEGVNRFDRYARREVLRKLNSVEQQLNKMKKKSEQELKQQLEENKIKQSSPQVGRPTEELLDTLLNNIQKATSSPQFDFKERAIRLKEEIDKFKAYNPENIQDLLNKTEAAIENVTSLNLGGYSELQYMVSSKLYELYALNVDPIKAFTNDLLNMNKEVPIGLIEDIVFSVYQALLYSKEYLTQEIQNLIAQGCDEGCLNKTLFERLFKNLKKAYPSEELRIEFESIEQEIKGFENDNNSSNKIEETLGTVGMLFCKIDEKLSHNTKISIRLKNEISLKLEKVFIKKLQDLYGPPSLKSIEKLTNDLLKIDLNQAASFVNNLAINLGIFDYYRKSLKLESIKTQEDRDQWSELIEEVSNYGWLWKLLEDQKEAPGADSEEIRLKDLLLRMIETHNLNIELKEISLKSVLDEFSKFSPNTLEDLQQNAVDLWRKLWWGNIKNKESENTQALAGFANEFTTIFISKLEELYKNKVNADNIKDLFQLLEQLYEGIAQFRIHQATKQELWKLFYSGLENKVRDLLNSSKISFEEFATSSLGIVEKIEHEFSNTVSNQKFSSFLLGSLKSFRLICLKQILQQEFTGFKVGEGNIKGLFQLSEQLYKGITRFEFDRAAKRELWELFFSELQNTVKSLLNSGKISFEEFTTSLLSIFQKIEDDELSNTVSNQEFSLLYEIRLKKVRDFRLICLEQILQQEFKGFKVGEGNIKDLFQRSEKLYEGITRFEFDRAAKQESLTLLYYGLQNTVKSLLNSSKISFEEFATSSLGIVEKIEHEFSNTVSNQKFSSFLLGSLKSFRLICLKQILQQEFTGFKVGEGNIKGLFQLSEKLYEGITRFEFDRDAKQELLELFCSELESTVRDLLKSSEISKISFEEFTTSLLSIFQKIEDELSNTVSNQEFSSFHHFLLDMLKQILQQEFKGFNVDSRNIQGLLQRSEKLYEGIAQLRNHQDEKQELLKLFFSELGNKVRDLLNSSEISKISFEEFTTSLLSIVKKNEFIKNVAIESEGFGNEFIENVAIESKSFGDSVYRYLLDRELEKPLVKKQELFNQTKKLLNAGLLDDSLLLCNTNFGFNIQEFEIMINNFIDSQSNDIRTIIEEANLLYRMIRKDDDQGFFTYLITLELSFGEKIQNLCQSNIESIEALKDDIWSIIREKTYEKEVILSFLTIYKVLSKRGIDSGESFELKDKKDIFQILFTMFQKIKQDLNTEQEDINNILLKGVPWAFYKDLSKFSIEELTTSLLSIKTTEAEIFMKEQYIKDAIYYFYHTVLSVKSATSLAQKEEWSELIDKVYKAGWLDDRLLEQLQNIIQDSAELSNTLPPTEPSDNVDNTESMSEQDVDELYSKLTQAMDDLITSNFPDIESLLKTVKTLYEKIINTNSEQDKTKELLKDLKFNLASKLYALYESSKKTIPDFTNNIVSTLKKEVFDKEFISSALLNFFLLFPSRNKDLMQSVEKFYQAGLLNKESFDDLNELCEHGNHINVAEVNEGELSNSTNSAEPVERVETVNNTDEANNNKSASKDDEEEFDYMEKARTKAKENAKFVYRNVYNFFLEYFDNKLASDKEAKLVEYLNAGTLRNNFVRFKTLQPKHIRSIIIDFLDKQKPYLTLDNETVKNILIYFVSTFDDSGNDFYSMFFQELKNKYKNDNAGKDMILLFQHYQNEVKRCLKQPIVNRLCQQKVE